MQSQTWTSAAPPAPADTSCPGPGWPTRQVVADHLVNADEARPLFRYAATPASSRHRGRGPRAHRAGQRVAPVDTDPVRCPRPELATSVILRNQNRAPVAAFSYTLLNPVTC